VSSGWVQNDESRAAFHHFCKTESAFVAFKVFCVLAYNCELDKILCMTSNIFRFKTTKLTKKE
jgi:hypothetical protein